MSSLLPTARRQIFYGGVGLYVPAAWPVIDGANAGHACFATFNGQADRAFLGPTYHGVPSCSVVGGPGWTRPTADGVWMQPGSATPPSEPPTTTSGGQVVYVTGNAGESDVNVWLHGISIDIGIGPSPVVEQAIFNSISYRPGTSDTEVLGLCPAPDPWPPPMPTPVRLTAPLVVYDADGDMRPEPVDIQPKISAAKVWSGFVASNGRFSGPMQWRIYFGSYSSQSPATINPDNSATPWYQNVPTWLIQGERLKTPYGSCSMSVVAPYNADNGRAMGLATGG